VTYIGHATLLIEIGGVRLLTDPNFDARLAGLLRRVAAPGLPIRGLPPLDALLVTHAHADHLSLASLAELVRNARRGAMPILAPPSVARWLRVRGYAGVTEAEPGSIISVGDVTVAVGPAAHVGARYGYDRWRGTAVTYLIESRVATVFFAGDTGLVPESHALVATRLGPHGRRLDVALLPIGHAPIWKPWFRGGHLSSADALTLFDRLGARYLIPYHWGTFHHVTSGPHDAIRTLRTLIPNHPRGSDVRILEPGATFVLDT
jgi:L-ascorbate metabolism protein UlaG (beta-lactamase superfamily)